MTGNFDKYIKMVRAAKKVGGPVGFVTLIFTTGFAIGSFIFGYGKK